MRVFAGILPEDKFHFVGLVSPVADRGSRIAQDGIVHVALSDRIRQTLFPGAQELPPESPLARRVHRIAHWVMLVLAIANLLLVAFNFSYLRLRPWYLRFAPGLVSLYDPVKGMSPHRTTQAYVAAADQAMARLASGDRSLATGAELAHLRRLSDLLYVEDPFAGSGQSGLFEQIKARMRKNMHVDSGRAALERFWTFDNLSASRFATQRAFYERRVRPLLDQVYFRRIGEDGQPYNSFWLLDMAFVPFFVVDFLARGLSAVRQKRVSSWKAFTYAHWPDLVYFLPLVAYPFPIADSGWFYAVRVVSVSHRMRRLGLIDPMAIPQRYATSVVDLLTDLVTVRLLTNTQESIQHFELGATLGSLTPEQRRRLRDFGNRHLRMVVERILPQISPRLEKLLISAARSAVEQSPSAQRLKRIPFVGDLPERLIPDLVAEILQGIQRALAASLDDETQQALVHDTTEALGAALVAEMAKMRSEDEIKALLVALLEDQKQRLLA